MDVRLAMYQQDIEKIEEDMLPFGYFLDGIEDFEDEVEDKKWGMSSENWLITDKKNYNFPWDSYKK